MTFWSAFFQIYESARKNRVTTTNAACNQVIEKIAKEETNCEKITMDMSILGWWGGTSDSQSNFCRCLSCFLLDFRANFHDDGKNNDQKPLLMDKIRDS